MRLIIIVMVIFWTNPLLAQMTAEEARNLASSKDLHLILARAKRYAKAGNYSMGCCHHRYSQLSEEKIKALKHLGYQVRLKPNQDRLRVLNRENYTISWMNPVDSLNPN